MTPLSRDNRVWTSGKKQAPGRSESRNKNIFYHTSEFDTYLPTTPFQKNYNTFNRSNWMFRVWIVTKMSEMKLLVYNFRTVRNQQPQTVIMVVKEKSILLQSCGEQPADPEEDWRSLSRGDKCHRVVSLLLLTWTHAELPFYFCLFLPMQLQIPSRTQLRVEVGFQTSWGGRRAEEVGYGLVGHFEIPSSPSLAYFFMPRHCFGVQHAGHGIRRGRCVTLMLRKGSVTCTLQVWTIIALDIRVGKPRGYFLLAPPFFNLPFFHHHTFRSQINI